MKSEGKFPKEDTMALPERGGGWLLLNKQQMSRTVALYDFQNTIIESDSFDFIILWECGCQLLFPFSDENTKAQIT